MHIIVFKMCAYAIQDLFVAREVFLPLPLGRAPARNRLHAVGCGECLDLAQTVDEQGVAE